MDSGAGVDPYALRSEPPGDGVAQGYGPVQKYSNIQPEFG
jgi:hypothetical protein